MRQLLVVNERQCGRLCKICRSTAAFSLHHRHSANVSPLVQWPCRTGPCRTGTVSGQGPDRTRHRSPMESSCLLSSSSPAALCFRTIAGAVTGTGLELICVPWGAATLGRQSKAVWQAVQDMPVDCLLALPRHNANVLSFGQWPCKTVTRASRALLAKVRTRHRSARQRLGSAVKSSLQQRACKLGALSLGVCAAVIATVLAPQCL